MEKFKDWYKKNRKIVLLFVCAFITSISFIYFTQKQAESKIETVSYNDFIEMAENGEIDKVIYNPTKGTMKFVLFNEATKDMTLNERKKYKDYEFDEYKKTFYPNYDDFRKNMLEYDIILEKDNSGNMASLVLQTLSLILPLAFIYWMFTSMGNQNKNFNEENLIQKSDIKFKDVIGQDEIIEDIQIYVDLLKNPKQGEDIGVNIPKGFLLTGPPGTGKTLIAKAIAGEADVPFINIGGSDFKEMFVGLGAKRVRSIFKLARKNAPCILFIDEIDAVGAKRGIKNSNSEDDQTINALLKEMDGFSGREGILIIAATNRPDVLDDALKRAGRFDRQIVVNPPRDWETRKQLFKLYLNKCKTSDDIDLDTLSKTISGFTGADISMICNEAGIVAISQKKDCIDQECLEIAIDKKVFNGNKSKKEQLQKDKNIVAYHEAGHAVMTYLLKQPIARATIQGTTSGVGGAVFREDTLSQFMTNEELKYFIMIAYAGRVSEEIKFKTITTGASNDITQATNVMLNYIQKYGFDKDFGLLDMEVLSQQSVIENKDITLRLSKMSKEMYKLSFDLLNENYDKVETLAQKLLEVETLSGNEIVDLLDGKGTIIDVKIDD